MQSFDVKCSKHTIYANNNIHLTSSTDTEHERCFQFICFEKTSEKEEERTVSMNQQMDLTSSALIILAKTLQVAGITQVHPALLLPWSPWRRPPLWPSLVSLPFLAHKHECSSYSAPQRAHTPAHTL